MANGLIPGVLMMALAQQQVQDAIGTGQPVSTGTVAALMATPTPTPIGCEKPVDRKDQKQTHGPPDDLEVVAIIEGTVPVNPVAQAQLGKSYFPYAFSQDMAQSLIKAEFLEGRKAVPPQGFSDWPLSEIQKKSAQLIDKYFEVEQVTPEGAIVKTILPPELKASLQRSFWIESILHFSAQEAALNPQLSEDVLAQKMAQAFEAASGGDASEKAALFTTWVSRMYENYNNEMNPGQNDHPVEDTRQIPLSKAIQSAVNWDLTYGGVCTNIAKAATVLGQKVFKGSDALVINSGTHFYNAFIDRNQNVQIFNWSSVQAGQRLALSMDPSLPTTNVRISKINEKGKLAEIAVPLNQRGILFQKMHGALSPSFSLEQDPSLARIKLSKGTLSTQVGAALTQQSKLWVVMASRDYKNSRLSVSGAYEQMNLPGDAKNVIVGVHYTWLKPIVHYQSPRVRVEWQVGGEANGTYGLGVDAQAKNRSSSVVPGISVNGELMSRLQARSLPGAKTNWLAEAGVAGFVGVKNWEQMQFGSSQQKGAGLRDSLSALSLPLQQVFASGEVQTPARTISNHSVGGVARGRYQGTAVGQQVQGELGVQVQSPSGLKVYAFAGYLKNDIKGFKTQYSAFQAPMGVTTRAGVSTPRGVQLELGSQGKSGNIKALVPIRGKKR